MRISELSIQSADNLIFAETRDQRLEHSSSSERLLPWRLGIINAFVIIGLLRLTNLNYYLSQLIGLEVTVDNLGGDAFNFNNYAAVTFLLILIPTKLIWDSGRWYSAWPIYGLMLVYIINALTAPFVNLTWVLYQLIFLSVGLVLHLYVQHVESTFVNRFYRGGSFIFRIGILLMIFCSFIIFSSHSWSYYLLEFNEVFVQSLDDFGIVKQKYGYLLGFMLAFSLFMVRSRATKVLVILLAVITGWGIRSFVIGCITAGLLYFVKRANRILVLVLLAAAGFFFLWSDVILSLVYDTRFYSYLNALHIIQEYPMGVGLGGYPEYTEQYQRQLYASYFDVSALLDYVPIAPESDVVHLLGSLGPWLGGIHIAIILRIVWLGYRLQDAMDGFQKCILFYFTFMTFFGISEDSIFSINYWVFFGLSSGIISRLLYLKRQPSVDE